MPTLQDLQFQLGVSQASADKVQASQLQEERKAAAAEASKLFNSGDIKGAFGALSKIDPSVLQDPMLAEFKAYLPSQGPQAKKQVVRGINPETKRIEIGVIDPDTNKVEFTGIDAGYAQQFRANPYTGELAPLNPGIVGPQGGLGAPNQKPVASNDAAIAAGKQAASPSQAVSSLAKRVVSGEIEDPGSVDKIPNVYSGLNPKQRKLVEDLGQSFDTETKTDRDAISRLPNVADITVELAKSNPIAWSQTGATVAKIFEEGRLTDEDVVRYTNRKDLPGIVRRKLGEWSRGTVSPQDAGLIQQTLKAYTAVVQAKANKTALDKARKLSRTGEIAGTEYDIAPFIYGGFSISPQDRDAIDWVKANPKDAAAKQVIQKLKLKGLY